MKNEKGDTLRYTNKNHVNKTKRLKYQKLMENYKKKQGIKEIENELCKFNSKTCSLEKFKEFIKKKNEINKRLLDKYKESIFRKYKWYSYINRKRAETDLVKEIKDTYGKDVKIIMGDWSDKMGTSNIKYMTTPNMGLKRKLAEYFTIYNLDEFRTSCLNHKTEEKCGNLYLPDLKGVMRKKHSILTYKTESKRMGCINRDENAVNNMIKIVKSHLTNGTRPEKYRRNYKKPSEEKTQEKTQEKTKKKTKKKTKENNPEIHVNSRGVKCSSSLKKVQLCV